MPTPEEILNGLALASQQFMLLSMAWHAVVILFLIWMISGRRPSNKTVALGLSTLLLSVAFVAMKVSNPFNAMIFLLATIQSIYITWKMPAEDVNFSWDFVTVCGLVMVVFGFVYPHFLEEGSWLRYLYASPLGLVPCPTLSLIIGFTLVFHGFYHKRWMLPLAIIGFFYGIIGVLRLKVYLDLVLIAGALCLLIYAFTGKRSIERAKE